MPAALSSSLSSSAVGGHGEPFPVPLAAPGDNFEKQAGRGRYLQQRARRRSSRERRVAESVRALNSLAATGAGGEMPPLQPSAATAAHHSVRQRVGRLVVDAGARPNTSSHEALFELLRTSDFYSEEAHPREPLDMTRVKMLRGNYVPRDLGQRLVGQARDLHRNYSVTIER